MRYLDKLRQEKGEAYVSRGLADWCEGKLRLQEQGRANFSASGLEFIRKHKYHTTNVAEAYERENTGETVNARQYCDLGWGALLCEQFESALYYFDEFSKVAHQMSLDCFGVGYYGLAYSILMALEPDEDDLPIHPIRIAKMWEKCYGSLLEKNKETKNRFEFLQNRLAKYEWFADVKPYDSNELEEVLYGGDGDPFKIKGICTWTDRGRAMMHLPALKPLLKEFEWHLSLFVWERHTVLFSMPDDEESIGKMVQGIAKLARCCEDEIYANYLPRPDVILAFHDIYSKFFIEHGDAAMFIEYAKQLIKSCGKIGSWMDTQHGTGIWVYRIYDIFILS